VGPIRELDDKPEAKPVRVWIESPKRANFSKRQRLQDWPFTGAINVIGEKLLMALPLAVKRLCPIM
jgi:hypothetical protein